MHQDEGFMTNTSARHRFILDALSVYYPGAIRVEDTARWRDGRVLKDYVAVYTGSKPLRDYGEFWSEFDRLLKLHGLREGVV